MQKTVSADCFAGCEPCSFILSLKREPAKSNDGNNEGGNFTIGGKLSEERMEKMRHGLIGFSLMARLLRHHQSVVGNAAVQNHGSGVGAPALFRLDPRRGGRNRPVGKAARETQQIKIH